MIPAFIDNHTTGRLTATPFINWESDNNLLGVGFIKELHIVAYDYVTLSRVSNGVCRFNCGGADYATSAVRKNNVSPIYSIATGEILGSCVFDALDDYAPDLEYIFKPQPEVSPRYILPFPKNKVHLLQDKEGGIATGEVVLAAGTGCDIAKADDKTISIGFPFVSGTSPLKTIRFEWEVGACIVPTLQGEEGEDQPIVGVTYQGRTLDEVCFSKQGNLMPDASGGLPSKIAPKLPLSERPWWKPDSGAVSSGSFDIDVRTLSSGSIYISALSTYGSTRLRLVKTGGNVLTWKIIG